MATKSIFFEKKQIVQNDKIVKANEKKKGISNRTNHSFETRPGDRPGQEIGSRVRWVNPG
jgi:hypothetical protein